MNVNNFSLKISFIHFSLIVSFENIVFFKQIDIKNIQLNENLISDCVSNFKMKIEMGMFLMQGINKSNHQLKTRLFFFPTHKD